MDKILRNKRIGRGIGPIGLIGPMGPIGMGKERLGRVEGLTTPRLRRTPP